MTKASLGQVSNLQQLALDLIETLLASFLCIIV